MAIIPIIAAIAIPNLLRARMAANESAAVGGVRTINTSEVTYGSTFPSIGFTSSLSSLGGTGSPCVSASNNACLIDSVLAGGTKSGYSFALGAGSGTGTPQPTYTVTASPVTLNQTGTRYFCSFEDAVVRYSTATIAGCDATSSALQ